MLTKFKNQKLKITHTKTCLSLFTYFWFSSRFYAKESKISGERNRGFRRAVWNAQGRGVTQSRWNDQFPNQKSWWETKVEFEKLAVSGPPVLGKSGSVRWAEPRRRKANPRGFWRCGFSSHNPYSQRLTYCSLPRLCWACYLSGFPPQLALWMQSQHWRVYPPLPGAGWSLQLS